MNDIPKQHTCYSKDEITIEKIKSKHIKDLTGLQFGKWHVFGYAGLNKDLKSTWWCYCECDPSKYYILVGSELSRGRTKSCGCLIVEENKNRSYLWKEAYTYNTSKKDIWRLHRIFNGMKERCYNLLSKDFPNYGGRGIKICDEWLLDKNSFVSWAFEHGYKNDLTIDRINVNGNYEPGNCRWITLLEQGDNKRTTIYVDYKDEKRTLLSVLRENGIKNNYSTYRSRFLKGWNLEKTINTPIRTSYKEITLKAILDYFSKNEGTISIPKLSKEINLSATSIYKYLRDDTEFVHILEINNIERIKGVGLRCKEMIS